MQCSKLSVRGIIKVWKMKTYCPRLRKHHFTSMFMHCTDMKWQRRGRVRSWILFELLNCQTIHWMILLIRSSFFSFSQRLEEIWIHSSNMSWKTLIWRSLKSSIFFWINPYGIGVSSLSFYLFAQLGGPDRVAEMTGRRGMLVRAQNGKGVIYQARNT